MRPLGVNDRFQDLGGKSMDLVQVHSLLLDRLKLEVDIATLFQHATVASLATHLSGRSDEGVTAAARVRGNRMREARARRTDRFGTEK